MEADLKSNKIKILAVDDNPKNIQVIGNLLRDAGYSVGFAYNGKQALDILREIQGFDLVLLDINMPVMNGLDTCKAMRKDDMLKDIPVIFLTALNHTEDLVAGFNAGGQDYVSKPFNYEEVISRVKTHIELKRSKDQLKRVNQWLEAKVQERTLEVKQAHGKLKKAYLELEQLDQSKSEFLAIISHQINTPLNGILGFIDILKHEIEDAHLQEMFEHLELSANRLNSFSKVSLKITRLRTRKVPLDKSDVAISAILQSSKDALANLIQAKNITFCIESNTNVVKGDPELIEFCLESILDNAIRYSRNNDTVKIDITSDEEYTYIRVVDKGKGFNPQSFSNLFDLFVSDNKYAEENKGLDLALVKIIMDAHQGQVTASNNDTVGASLLLTFPNKL
ncbi:hybrid sensor histidine kinase/response regulator [Saccharicrinis fermentans]|uniref:histidine kinase n=1 Tax=Saccharicrinis fermentans DSM 9555 = JCM 21142 TaxID=869213 RepID=W7YK46_9BACT|nr:hybrid sensor histidine kinase/response regulator [Saccharicrinis fermentans]GAF02704.1 transcriptional regulatory protein BaeR [Saccharicrinis fermentans DSM 9555 = JCM 21142]